LAANNRGVLGGEIGLLDFIVFLIAPGFGQ